MHFLSYSQVNGKDLSNASHEETVKAFHAAEDPIVVEIARKGSRPANVTSSTETTDPRRDSTASAGTQTEPIIGCCCHTAAAFSLPSPPPINR